MNQKLLILQYGNPSRSEMALSKIADFLGAESECIRLDNCGVFTSMREARSSRYAISGDTLVHLQEKGELHLFQSVLREEKNSLFVYGVSSSISFTKALKELTQGLVSKSIPFNAQRGQQVKLSSENREILAEMTGLSFSMPQSASIFSWLVQNDRAGLSILISLGNSPFFLRLIQANSEIYLAASEKIHDIDEEVQGEPDLKEHFLDFFPAIIFIKYVFRGYVWKGAHKNACLIIDDPLIRQKYGRIEFSRLLSAMNKFNFSCSIGFIPWNYKRSKKAGVSLFKSSQGRLSVCVHGSDHLKGEFASEEYRLIDEKLKTAINRMNAHQNLTGLSFDKVMVFPQGIFSLAAMKSLKHNNFLAAINFEVIPYMPRNPQPLRAFLQPAVMCYSYFPLYVRRNPNQIEELAMDSYLDRPIFLMTHQDSFKGEYEEIIESVKKINRLHSSIEWLSLAEACKRTYQVKKEPDDTVNIKIFSTQTLVANTFKHKKAVFFKEEIDYSAIEEIRIGGRRVQHDSFNDTVRFVKDTESHNLIEIQITYKDPFNFSIDRPRVSFPHKARVFLRRHLCEMRDYGVSRGVAFLSRIR